MTGDAEQVHRSAEGSSALAVSSLLDASDGRAGRALRFASAPPPDRFGRQLASGLVLCVLTFGLAAPWLIVTLRRALFGTVRVANRPIDVTVQPREIMFGSVLIVVVIVALAALAAILASVIASRTSVGLRPDAFAFATAVTVAVLGILGAGFARWARLVRGLRWCGIAPMVENGTVRYAVLSGVLWCLTILSFGLLYPLCHFERTRFKLDRCRLAGLPVTQRGRWSALVGYWVWVYLPLAAVLGVVIGLLSPVDPEASDEYIAVRAALAVAVVVCAAAGFAVALFRYRLVAWRYLWDNRYVGACRVRSDLQVSALLWVVLRGEAAAILGAFICLLAGSLALSVLGGLAAGNGAAIGLDTLMAGVNRPETSPATLFGAVLIVLISCVTGLWIHIRLVTVPVFRQKAFSLLLETPETIVAELDGRASAE